MSQNSDPIVIAGMARTAMGGFQGELAPLTAPQLGAAAIRAALSRAGVAAEDLDEVGNLLLRLDDGRLVTVPAGDVDPAIDKVPASHTTNANKSQDIG